VGSGIAGLVSSEILCDEFKTMVVEAKPSDELGLNNKVLMLESQLRNLERVGLEVNSIDAYVFDNTQIHDVNGKVIFEYSYPLVILDLNQVLRSLLKNAEVDIMLGTKATGRIDLKRKEFLRVGVEGRKRESIQTRYLVDASGRYLYVSRRGMIAQGYRLSKHNIYHFYQSIVSDLGRICVDKSSIHLILSDIHSPGGFSWCFVRGDKAYIQGFYNSFLSSVSSRMRSLFVKNSLGIVGRLSIVKKWTVPLGHPILSPAYERSFFMGSSNMSIYPLFVSGIGHNIVQTMDLSKKLARIVGSNNIADEGYIEYMRHYTKNHIFRGFLNDFLRIMFLELRTQNIEDLATNIFDTVSIISRTLESTASLITLAHIAVDILERVGFTRKVRKIISLLIELYKLQSEDVENFGEIAEKSQHLNKIYDERIGEIMEPPLKQRITFKELDRRLASTP